jgi:hypothetical protein
MVRQIIPLLSYRVKHVSFSVTIIGQDLKSAANFSLHCATGSWLYVLPRQNLLFTYNKIVPLKYSVKR